MKVYLFFILQNNKIKYFFVKVLMAVIFSVLCFMVVPGISIVESAQILYTENQLQKFVSPSIVRIVQHIQGTAQIPLFIIDFTKHTISIDKNKNTTRVTDVNTNIIGSGVIVSPNGHILTNAHLVSDMASKLAIIDPFMREDILKAGDVASDNIEKDKAFSIEIRDFIIKNSVFELQKEIVILNPVEQIIKDNKETSLSNKQPIFPASILYVNNNFYKDNNNIAIIQITNKNLPSLAISNDHTFSTGEKLYVLETPTLTDFITLNDFNNKGAYAFNIKETFVDTNQITQNNIYTKTKFIPETSGSPLFNKFGKVVGLLTSDGQISYGQSINMFVIPNSNIQPILTRAGVVSATGSYAQHFARGFEYANNGFCEKSNQEFELALINKTPFTKNITINSLLLECDSTTKTEIQPEINKLSFFSIIQKKLFTSSNFLNTLIIILVVILLLILLVAAIILMKSLKKYKNTTSFPFEDTQKSEILSAKNKSLIEVLPKILNNNTLNNSFITENKVSEIVNSNAKENQTPSIISNNEQECLAQLWPDKYVVQSNKDNTENTQQTTNNEIEVNKNITDYIKETQNQGFSAQDIRMELLRAGWSANDIDVAFTYLEKEEL